MHSSHGPGHSGSCSHQLQEIDVGAVTLGSGLGSLRCGALERIQGLSNWMGSALGQGRTSSSKGMTWVPPTPWVRVAAVPSLAGRGQRASEGPPSQERAARLEPGVRSPRAG